MKALQTPTVRAAVAGALLALALGAVALLALREVAGRPPPLEIVLPTATPLPSHVVVHLAGEVARPGVYTFPAGTRLEEAIQAAGGPTPEADLDAVNRAQLVRDGQRYWIPKRGEAAGAASPRLGPLDLNSASARELEALEGIGAVLAQRIIAYRQENGPYQRVEDLLAVSGIGPALLERLRPQVTVR